MEGFDPIRAPIKMPASKPLITNAEIKMNPGYCPVMIQSLFGDGSFPLFTIFSFFILIMPTFVYIKPRI